MVGDQDMSVPGGVYGVVGKEVSVLGSISYHRPCLGR